MALPVSLRDVVQELDGLMDECTVHLNRETGELYMVRDDEAVAVEDGLDSGGLPDWMDDELPKIREVLSSEAWLAMPTNFDIHEWAIMERFARSIEDVSLRDELLDAIRGRGAFRCFKDSVHRRGIQQDWYDFKAVELERLAIDWLDEHGIPYVREEEAVPREPQQALP